MTTANKITLTRIAMIPFFLYFASQPMFIHDKAAQAQTMVPTFVFPTATVIALILFCVASFTDFLDGYVARKYNQVTDFGKFVDPLADKLLVSSALILFAEQGAVAGWMVCVILARELIITSLRVVAANKGRVLAATWTGKVKTCVQIGGIILIYLYYILIGAAGSGMIGGADGWTSVVVTVNSNGVDSLLSLIGWVMTLVTLYSGFDYLRKNWDIIKDGAVKQK
ncbi:MAG: CDP-diacylglycerol--glycerol-3-phosphate 3-phosphatidyltransferase [Agathobaculum sp.]|jgi:CDP-diacylglycerol--glycerol-3-phosphate 3-phosphatidyltransferase|uniref:CDP-diacylglycerol--glycerol-3-phosphate 3-phosphatidyltransferase n=1 Tax=Agathobaculum sp. TaxID=2048138 RepID=UPI003D8AC0B4